MKKKGSCSKWGCAAKPCFFVDPEGEDDYPDLCPERPVANGPRLDPGLYDNLSGHGGKCKTLEVSFQSRSRESTTRHSSQGGELGEQIAILSTTRVSYAPAEPVLRVLDRIEAASPTNVRRTMNGEIGQ